jgi:hypothetical protein
MKQGTCPFYLFQSGRSQLNTLKHVYHLESLFTSGFQVIYYGSHAKNVKDTLFVSLPLFSTGI